MTLDIPHICFIFLFVFITEVRVLNFFFCVLFFCNPEWQHS